MSKSYKTIPAKYQGLGVKKYCIEASVLHLKTATESLTLPLGILSDNDLELLLAECRYLLDCRAELKKRGKNGL